MDKLAADGMVKFQNCQNERWRQEQQWYLNLAFFFGQHYLRFLNDNSNNRFTLHVPKAPYYRVRPVINQVRKVIRKEISRLTSQKPNAYVIPSSIENRDVFAAQAAEQLWSSIWRQHKLNKIVRSAVFWQAVTGNGFIKHWWNPGKPDYDNDMMGDIDYKVITPFHLFVPDLKEEEIEDQPCVIHAQVVNREWLRSRLDMDISSADLHSVDEALLRVMGIDQQAERDNVIILEVWEKPGYNRELPEGGVYTIVANRVVRGFEGWPYSHHQYPFSKLDGIPTGKFYNSSIIEDLIPIQRELNRTRGQIIEAKNLMAKPQIRVEEGSIVTSKMTSEPGQMILYKMGFAKPEPMPLQPLPGYVAQEVDRLYVDIADLSGQHEVSQGQTPPGVTAAVAISYLQEQDESLITPHFDSLEEVIEKLAKQSLVYVKDYWDESRTIKTTGENSSFDVLAFKGSDLEGNTDIRVEAGSALPTSRAAKQAYITDLMKMGFIPPQEGLEVLEIGGLNKIYERIQIDARQAQRENLRMSRVTEQDLVRHKEEWMVNTPPQQQLDKDTGAPLAPPLIIPTNTWDNHPVHIEHHNRYRKSQAFETADSVVKAVFEEHVKEHMEAQLIGLSMNVPPGLSNPLENPGEQSMNGQNSEQPMQDPMQQGGVNSGAEYG